MKKVILGLAFVAFTAAAFAGNEGDKKTCNKDAKACCKKSGKTCEKKAEDKKAEEKK